MDGGWRRGGEHHKNVYMIINRIFPCTGSQPGVTGPMIVHKMPFEDLGND